MDQSINPSQHTYTYFTGIAILYGPAARPNPKRLQGMQISEAFFVSKGYPRRKLGVGGGQLTVVYTPTTVNFTPLLYLGKNGSAGFSWGQV